MTKPKPQTSLSEWQKRARRPVELPSGAVVTVELISIQKMIKAGRIPNPLIAMATEYHAKGLDVGELTGEQLEKWEELGAIIVAASVRVPEITPSDCAGLPEDDLAYLRGIAFRIFPMPQAEDATEDGDEDEPRTVADLAPFPARGHGE